MIQSLGIQRTYVINLKRRPEKLHFCSNELKRLGVNDFQHVEAIDAINLELSSPRLSPSGAIGCTLSHRLVFWDAVNRGYERIMVCEDDIILVPQIEKKLPAVINAVPSDWQMLWFGSAERRLKTHEPRSKALKINDHIYKTDDPVGSHCVIFNGKEVIKQAYELLTGLGHVDCEFAHLGRLVRSYRSTEVLIDQRRNLTDIWPDDAKHYNAAWYAKKK